MFSVLPAESNKHSVVYFQIGSTTDFDTIYGAADESSAMKVYEWREIEVELSHLPRAHSSEIHEFTNTDMAIFLLLAKVR